MSKFLDMTGLTHFKNKMINVVNSGLNKKVDKVTGKSLISDTEITRLAKVDNYDDSGIKADIKNNSDNIDTNKTNISTLAKHINGDLLDSDFQEDSTVAMTKTVPSGMAGYAAISKIGGRTQKMVQLVSEDLASVHNVTLDSSSSKYSYAIAYRKDHVYMMSAKSNTYPIRFQVDSKYGICKIEVDSNARYLTKFTCNYPDFSSGAFIYNTSSSSYAVTGNFLIFDLTEMGIPDITEADFRAMFPEDYYPYTEGELWNTPVESVVSTSADGTTETTLLLPESDKSLPCFGYGITDEVQNIRDYENGTYTQMVAEVDLGDLTWNKSEGYQNTFIASIVEIQMGSLNEIGNILCSKYVTESFDKVVYSELDKAIALGTAHNIAVTDKSYTDVTAFKEAMKGVKLVYELETPVVIDCSDMLMPIRCESGGTITFTNEHSLDMPNTVVYKKEVSLS